MYQPVKQKHSAAPAISKFEISQFLGCDVTDEPSNVAPNRSPSCPNMIRESRGKVRKRTGYRTYKRYPARINGVHLFRRAGEEKLLVHAGTVLYLDGGTENYQDDAVLYSDAADIRSAARQLGGKLYIADGKKLLLFGLFKTADAEGSETEGWEIRPVEDEAYTPTIIVSRNPTGGGTIKDPINLLGRRRTEQFLGAANTKVYQLTANKLDEDPVTAKKLKSDGTWEELSEGAGITVDRETGKVTFDTAPGESPSLGVDNVYITYCKTIEGYAGKINRCDVATLYGVNGAKDRLFLAGNPDTPNQDYYSQQNDPTFFGDSWYSTLGQDSSAIMGYSEVNNMLAAHKDDSDDGENIILRNGTLDEKGRASFKRVGAYQSRGAASKYAFSVMETEPVFLVNHDVMAITPSDIIGERYAQQRSYYLQRALKQAGDLSEAAAISHDQFYFLSVGGNTYVLDGMQLSIERNTPFSYRQYEAYYWPGVDARVWFEREGRLCFGTADGRLAEFPDDYDDIGNFNDDGAPVYAAWQTPEFYGKDFYNRKDFQKISVLLGAATATGCRIWAIYDGQRELLKDYDGSARYFSFRNLTFSKLSFKTDKTPQELIEKIKIKNVRKISFLFENGVLNEPFGLYMATTEFIESR